MKEILLRKSIRSFESKKIEKEKIEQILLAAMSAPSANNLQLWEFIVVDDVRLLEKIGDMSPYAKCAKNAPLAIVVLVKEQGEKGLSRWYSCDTSAATQNILTEATYLGLGSVWLGVDPDGERKNYLRTLLNIPDSVHPCSVVLLGYSKNELLRENPKEYKVEKIHFNKFRN